MSKLNYKTSKDYKRLKELLDKGEEVVILWVQEVLPAMTKINAASMASFVKYPTSRRFDSYRLGPTSVWRGDFSKFEEVCKFWDFSFIEPNWEE